MKKIYTQPEITVTKLVSGDVITLSGLSTPQTGTDIKSVGKSEIPF